MNETLSSNAALYKTELDVLRVSLIISLGGRNRARALRFAERTEEFQSNDQNPRAKKAVRRMERIFPELLE